MNSLIGNTPMIKIIYEYKGKIKEIYTKLEYYNLTGSIKDRMAYYILNSAKKEGILRDEMTIVEATSGNTGISIAALGAKMKHKVIIYMPDWVSAERVKLMESFGAIIILISKEEGGFKECIRQADLKAEEIKGYRPKQFDNLDNIEAHYQTTGKEIIEKNPLVDGFVSGIGTGGTLIGIGKRLKEHNKKAKICAIEPDSMPLLTKNKIIKNHKIEGIGDDFIPSLVKKNMIDEIFLINDMDAINMARKLAKELGLGVGISSGANMLGAIILRENQKNVVTVFPDDNKKYLSTDLLKKVDANLSFLSNQIKLIDYEIV